MPNFEATPYQQDIITRTVDLEYEAATVNVELARKRLEVVNHMLEFEKKRLADYSFAKDQTRWHKIGGGRLQRAIAAANQVLAVNHDKPVVTLDKSDLYQLVESLKLAMKPL